MRREQIKGYRLGGSGAIFKPIRTFFKPQRIDGALGNLVLGSVAPKVPASCTVPVLLVRDAARTTRIACGLNGLVRDSARVTVFNHKTRLRA